MAHNLKGRGAAELNTFSGTVSLARPEDLPEGASPRSQNVDFTVGGTRVRQGLQNRFSFSGSGSGPNGGALAADQGGVVPWSNPANILLDDGSYATCVVPGAAGQQINTPALSISSGGGWSNPGNALLNSGYASRGIRNIGDLVIAVAAPNLPSDATVSGIAVRCNAYSNASGNNLICSLSISGSSPISIPLATASSPVTLGSATTSWGLSLSPSLLNGGFSFDFNFTGSSGTGYINDTVLTIYYTIPSASNALRITEFSFSEAVGSQITGVTAALKGLSTNSQTAVMTLVAAGSEIGTSKQLTLPASDTSQSVGAASDPWNALLTSGVVNATSFGVDIVVTGQGTASLGYVSIAVSIASSSVNFNYVTTFEDSAGNIRTLAIDASGNWWIEDVNAAPGVLSPLSSIEGTPAGSFGSSFNADSRQFIAVSDLLKGVYPPQGYSTRWTDRVSQVGPGAAPSFTGTLQASNVAPITNYSGSAGILTLTAANNFTAGEVVQIFAGAADALYPLNNLRFNVLGTGLSATQFEISTSLVTGTGTSTARATGQYTYPINASPNGITQYPFWNSAQGYQSGLDGILWSAGPGQTTAGNVITVYYLQGSHGLPDANLVVAMQAQKFPVYVYIAGTPQPLANGTQLVTSVGVGTPPGAAATRWYFTFNVAQVGSQNLGSGANSLAGTYQLTVATVTSSLPLPGVETGDDVTISGDSIASWNVTWPIVNALNSGAYSISQTSMASGVATYNWALAGATSSPPVAGQLVTITGTLNGNGIFNVTDAVIGTVTGTSSGTFTISGFAQNLNYSAQAEVAQATTSGTQFQIDPGALTLGNAADDPIYGNSGGGYITLVGSSSLVVSAGTRKGTVFFITRNGLWTPVAAPVQFTTPSNTNYVLVSNIPIGPPNVIARAIVLTEAGAQGQAGANYYTIPEPVEFVFNGVTYQSSSFFINDNTTTTAQLTFTDAVLLSAAAVDQQGGDLFNLIELPDAAWCVQYAGRGFWGRVNNQIQNFVNLSFDGGYNPNPGGNLLPLGWGLDASTSPNGSPPTLLNSPIFGNSYYIQNQTGAAQAKLDMITQTAYQDWENVPILRANTLYSIRVTCRTPSSATVGALVIDLTSHNTASGYGQTYGSFTLNCSAMTSAMATYTGTLLTTAFSSVPTDLLLRVWASNLAAGGDIEIDRIGIYPTTEPQNLTGLVVSYEQDWESFDDVTGGIDTATVNAQPANGAFVMDSKLFILKESSMGYVSETPGQEPANWNPYREISNQAGAAGINAWDVDRRGAVMANENGLFGFVGGNAIPIQIENNPLWAAISWENYGHTVVVRHDVKNQRILIAAPMPTPNQWCPDFAANANPTQPNVILYVSYQGIDSFEAMLNSAPLHVTLMGDLAVHELRRKTSLWSIAAPYMAICKRSELFSEMLFCNGIGSSKIYALGSYTSGNDDGAAFPKSYCTYGFVSEKKAMEQPVFGEFNKRFALWDVLASGKGTVSLTFFQNILGAPYPFAVPGGITLADPQYNDIQGPLNEFSMRMFVEMKANDATTYFNWSRCTLVGQADPWSPIRGF